jgi:hypothetical protein
MHMHAPHTPPPPQLDKFLPFALDVTLPDKILLRKKNLSMFLGRKNTRRFPHAFQL